MKKTVFIMGLALIALPSCLKSNENEDYVRPSGVVTVCPRTDGSFVMNLDRNTVLIPDNLTKSPFGQKEVRALVSYSEVPEEQQQSGIRDVRVIVHRLDSIRTKLPVDDAGEDNDRLYGSAPIEIVRDWVTVAEDGYLTLRVRTLWGNTGVKHNINLLRSSDNSFEFELRHDACGDVAGNWGDALIAFNMKEFTLLNEDFMDQKICLKWQSFSGDKRLEFTVGELLFGPEQSVASEKELRLSKLIH